RAATAVTSAAYSAPATTALHVSAGPPAGRAREYRATAAGDRAAGLHRGPLPGLPSPPAAARTPPDRRRALPAPPGGEAAPPLSSALVVSATAGPTRCHRARGAGPGSRRRRGVGDGVRPAPALTRGHHHARGRRAHDVA